MSSGLQIGSHLRHPTIEEVLLYQGGIVREAVQVAQLSQM